MKYIIKTKYPLFVVFFWSQIVFASNPWLIHEPYWQYNPQELRAYAKRIYKTISPYFIKADQIDEALGHVMVGNERIKVRKETQFGRVLPNIFLGAVLAHVGDKTKAVPRLFLLPKKNVNIQFNFLLPHYGMRCGSDHNCIQVESDSFEIYLEFIEGEGKVGDKSFFPFGHADFNAKQIITSSKDGKKYLIDTKEEKNFFLPPLSPYKDGFASYWLFHIGRKIPQHITQFETWQANQRGRMISQAHENFGPAKSIIIDLGAADSIDVQGIDTINYAAQVFDDNNGAERYFPLPKDNVARYLYLGRVDLIKQLTQEYGEVSLDGITIPFRDDYRAYELNPVQFALKSSSFSHPEILAILKMFAKEKEYFSNAAATDSDVDKWPLYLALLTGDDAIFLLVAESGADINGKVGARAILTHIVEQMIGNTARKGLETIFSQVILNSNQTNIKEALTDVLKNVKEFRQEKIGIAHRLIKHVTTIDQELVKDIFNLGDESLIESILSSHFDYEKLLLTAMEKIKDPSHDYLRLVQGDTSGINYFWYELVKKILAQKSKYPEADVAIDKAIVHAMVNSKVKILCELLQHKPQIDLQMVQEINVLKNQLSRDILMDHAIEQGCARVVQFLGEHGFAVSILQIRKALRARDNDAVFNALIKAKTINLHDGLNEAIDYGNFSAAKIFLSALYQKGLTPSSVNHQKIFQSDSTELKTMVKGLSKTSTGSATLMETWEIKNILKKQDIKTLIYLVDHNINLGEILIEVVHHIIFAKHNTVTIGPEWWDLLDKLSAKDLPADSLDAALASALVNSRLVIVELFLNQLNKIKDIPEKNQRVRAVIKQNIRTPYMSDEYFKEALSTGNIDLVKMYLEQGMPIKPENLLYLPLGKSREQIEILLLRAMKN